MQNNYLTVLKNRIKNIVFSLVMNILYLSLSAQSNGKTHSSYEFIAEIKQVDTVSIIQSRYSHLFKDSILKKSDTVICIKIIMTKKIKGQSRLKSNRIVIDLAESPHSCSFNFEVKKKYLIFAASTARYNSLMVKKEFRKYFFVLDCFLMPVIQPD